MAVVSTLSTVAVSAVHKNKKVSIGCVGASVVALRRPVGGVCVWDQIISESPFHSDFDW